MTERQSTEGTKRTRKLDAVDENQRLFEIFLDVQRGLPRQGPGSDESTIKALSLCTELPDRLAILDIGSGPGMQTVALAKTLSEGHITAVDLHQEYLGELKERAKAAKVIDHIDILVGDMNRLAFSPRSFNLIWSEGAAYIMGFEKALIAWRRFLKSGGCIAVSELVWLRPDPSTEVAAFFGSEYPAMTDISTILATIRASKSPFIPSKPSTGTSHRSYRFSISTVSRCAVTTPSRPRSRNSWPRVSTTAPLRGPSTPSAKA